jgi:ribosomal protein S20
MKQNIKKFIAAIVEDNYKRAHEQLKKSIDEKIKRQIINNNTNIF